MTAIAALDEAFFRVRLDRLTPKEKQYLRAMAELGHGPHRSGDIAAQHGCRVTDVGPVRNKLVLKGMIWSPGYGDTAFTVPLFDQSVHETCHAGQRVVEGSVWARTINDTGTKNNARGGVPRSPPSGRTPPSVRRYVDGGRKPAWSKARMTSCRRGPWRLRTYDRDLFSGYGRMSLSRL